MPAPRLLKVNEEAGKKHRKGEDMVTFRTKVHSIIPSSGNVITVE